MKNTAKTPLSRLHQNRILELWFNGIVINNPTSETIPVFLHERDLDVRINQLIDYCSKNQCEINKAVDLLITFLNSFYKIKSHGGCSYIGSLFNINEVTPDAIIKHMKDIISNEFILTEYFRYRREYTYKSTESKPLFDNIKGKTFDAIDFEYIKKVHDIFQKDGYYSRLENGIKGEITEISKREIEAEISALKKIIEDSLPEPSELFVRLNENQITHLHKRLIQEEFIDDCIDDFRILFTGKKGEFTPILWKDDRGYILRKMLVGLRGSVNGKILNERVIVENSERFFINRNGEPYKIPLKDNKRFHEVKKYKIVGKIIEYLATLSK